MSFCVQGLHLLKKPKNQISFHRHFKGVASVQDFIYCLKFQIDKNEVDDTDTANQLNQTCSCKGVEIMRIVNFIENVPK